MRKLTLSADVCASLGHAPSQWLDHYGSVKFGTATACSLSVVSPTWTFVETAARSAALKNKAQIPSYLDKPLATKIFTTIIYHQPLERLTARCSIIPNWLSSQCYCLWSFKSKMGGCIMAARSFTAAILQLGGSWSCPVKWFLCQSVQQSSFTSQLRMTNVQCCTVVGHHSFTAVVSSL